jgi:hypothetical protein
MYGIFATGWAVAGIATQESAHAIEAIAAQRGFLILPAFPGIDA